MVELITLIHGAAHRGVEAEALLVDTNISVGCHLERAASSNHHTDILSQPGPPSISVVGDVC